MRKHRLVDRLPETGTEFLMNMHRSINNLFDNLISRQFSRFIFFILLGVPGALARENTATDSAENRFSQLII